MPSAKMVAQKPAGSLSPESLSGHATLVDCASVGELCASAETLPAQQAPSMAITYHGFLYRASFIVVPLRSHLSHATVERNHYACMTVERSANRRLREIGVNRSELPTTHRKLQARRESLALRLRRAAAVFHASHRRCNFNSHFVVQLRSSR